MKRPNAHLLLCLIGLLTWPSFRLVTGDLENPAPPFVRAYDFNDPDQTFELPDKLTEISGLSLSSAGDQLVAIQDEAGFVFMVDKLTGKVDAEIPFWKDGDYEGVEMVGSDIYALKSTGTLYQIKNAGAHNQETIKFNAFLSKDNDAEGLAYDGRNNRLLIACKDKAGDGDQYDKKKAIYAFDLGTKRMQDKPAYVIGLKAVWAYLELEPDIRKLEKIREFFSPEGDDFSFSPSGLAIHPITGDLYLTSSKGKLLLVMGTDGSVRHIEKLKKEVHPQPEGICFDRDGTLYVSNEGKGEKPRIHRFRYQQN